MTAVEVDEPVQREAEQERPQPRLVAEPRPVPRPQPPGPEEGVGPDRLNDVVRVEPGAEPGGHLATHDHAEVRPVGQEKRLGGGGVAIDQPFTELSQAVVAHA